MIGHNEVGVSVDAEGLPVPGAVGLQGLVGHKAFPLLAPLVNDGELLFGLYLREISGPTPRIRHYEKGLESKTNEKTDYRL